MHIVELMQQFSLGPKLECIWQHTPSHLLFNTSHQGDMLSVNNWHKTKGLAMDDNNIVAIRDLEIQIFLKKIPKFHG